MINYVTGKEYTGMNAETLAAAGVDAVVTFKQATKSLGIAGSKLKGLKACAKLVMFKEDEDGEMTYCVKGTIQEPVVWEFIITMTKEDIPGLMMMALNRTILSMFFSNLKSFMESTLKYLPVLLGLKKGVKPDKAIKGLGKK